VRMAYFDCFSGASGDMIIASLLSAGLKLAELQRHLQRLPLAGYKLSARKVRRAGFAGTAFNVKLEHHHAGHGAHHSHAAERGLPDILQLIHSSDLDKSVQERAAKIFRRLAKAESRAHGKPISEVHFHEVGAVDSIVDIVGAAIAVHLLGIERVECSPMALGNGTVQCAHGTLPVPAPGTAALLEGVPIRNTDVQGELTTPTGAAILTTLASSFGPMPAMTIGSVGVGAGGADRPQLPNLLRVFICETAT